MSPNPLDKDVLKISGHKLFTWLVSKISQKSEVFQNSLEILEVLKSPESLSKVSQKTRKSLNCLLRVSKSLKKGEKSKKYKVVSYFYVQFCSIEIKCM